MRNAVHRPPADSVVEALVRAGVSRPTALAMERHKALETLDLLDSVRIAAPDGPVEGAGAAIGHGTL